MVFDPYEDIKSIVQSGGSHKGVFPPALLWTFATIIVVGGVGIPIRIHYNNKDGERLEQIGKRVVEEYADADCDGLVSMVEAEKFLIALADEKGHVYRKARLGSGSYGFFKPDAWWRGDDPNVSFSNQIEMFESYQPKNTAPVQTKNCRGKWMGNSYSTHKLP